MWGRPWCQLDVYNGAIRLTCLQLVNTAVSLNSKDWFTTLPSTKFSHYYFQLLPAFFMDEPRSGAGEGQKLSC